jgi:hypothetical protein
MRVLCLAVVMGLLASPAYAQSKSIPRYGELDKDKTPQQKQADRDAEQAYQRSLGNIPDKGATDPWGNVRTESTPKTAAKSAPEKRDKTGTPAN